MAAPSRRLSHDQATRIVTAWRERLASDFSLSCNIVYRPHEFLPPWDTIAVMLKPPCRRLAKQDESAMPMLTLREAIKIWHAVSCCVGFGFHENPSFWEHALRIQFQARRARLPLVVTDSFPVVVINWDPRGDYQALREADEQQEFGFHLGSFFGMLGDDSTTRSLAYQESLQGIDPFVQSLRVKAVLIRVKLRIAVDESTGTTCLAYLISQYQTILAHLQSLPQHSDLEPKLVLVGLQLMALAPPRSVDFRWLHQLLERMPQQIPLEFILHPLGSDKVMAQRRNIMPLLEQVMGRVGGPLGRLELLDLSSFSDVTDLGAVCSLLPHSRSICEVRFKIRSTSGLLWLAYAMFHPSSRQTKWTRLCLDDCRVTATELQVMQSFLGSRNGSEVLRCVASHPVRRLREYPAALSAMMAEPTGTLRGYVIRTATLTERTNVYATGGPVVSPIVLAVLPADATVELAEDDTSDLPQFVHVIVPGCGLGVVPKAHLKEITTQEYPGRRTSCITVLNYGSYRSNRAVATGILHEFLPALRHVGVKPPLAFLQRPAPLNPLIESVNGCCFTTQSCEWMQSLPRLHSLGLSCTADQLHQLHSAIRSAFTGGAARRRSPLRALRLLVDIRNASIADCKSALPLFSTLIREELKGLRVIDIVFSKDRGRLNRELDEFAAKIPSSQPGLALGKCAFLWALHTCRLQSAAALDAYVIAVIFGYCGPSLDYVSVRRISMHVHLALESRDQLF